MRGQSCSGKVAASIGVPPAASESAGHDSMTQ